ncbi:uncharacterized, partial [Tachysurus ichikawai]
VGRFGSNTPEVQRVVLSAARPALSYVCEPDLWENQSLLRQPKALIFSLTTCLRALVPGRSFSHHLPKTNNLTEHEAPRSCWPLERVQVYSVHFMFPI